MYGTTTLWFVRVSLDRVAILTLAVFLFGICRFYVFTVVLMQFLFSLFTFTLVFVSIIFMMVTMSCLVP